ncbi:pseudopaline biosynthesis protein CntL [Paenibacillus elgii]|uniref:nicotianamine synthase family protein n=1 Tax=Paenibacillus elgii TaxID=189691 RepID=UPI002D7BD99C|nr:pseudopaline biosynthesis protein CntL [Paenibacillus elgii]
MKHRDAFLLSLKLLEYEIRQLTDLSRQCPDGFDLLQTKLGDLCRFMISEENERQWLLWSDHEEVRQHGERLRETSARALCDMEKYQSIRTLERRTDMGRYLSVLSDTVQDELRHFRIGCTSKVLFVGAGAFPLTALTIAKETRADVLCLDIDAEALDLGSRIAKVSGLHDKVQFSGHGLKELSFAKEATHVMIASLVKNKLEVLEDLRQAVHQDTSVILRYGNGLKSIFNYPLESDLSQEWELSPVVQGRSIYDTLMIKPKWTEGR